MCNNARPSVCFIPLTCVINHINTPLHVWKVFLAGKNIPRDLGINHTLDHVYMHENTFDMYCKVFEFNWWLGGLFWKPSCTCADRFGGNKGVLALCCFPIINDAHKYSGSTSRLYYLQTVLTTAKRPVNFKLELSRSDVLGRRSKYLKNYNQHDRTMCTTWYKTLSF